MLERLHLKDKFEQSLKELQDVRVLGLGVFVVIVLLMSYSGVKVIYTNYQLQQQIAAVQQQDDIQKLQNENQKLKNEYYNSPQYLELSARENFGLAAPGEKELIVPKAVAMAYVPASMSSGPAGLAPADHKVFYARNVEAWWNFFLHRATPTD